MNKATIHKDLLDWYDKHQRILPWRENLNPYFILVSEIMLQQTKVQTVIPFYERFIKELPDIESLANAKEEKLLKLWEGLGYYNRVRNLQKAALTVVHQFGGVIPQTVNELESLSGIGPYTAGAISSIAFNHKHSAVDGNVLRVFARILEIKENIKNTKTKKKIKDYVESILPDQRIGDFNQGLMEIGATICIPNGNPLCVHCPFESYCLAHKHKTISEIPLKIQKKKIPQEKKTVLLLEYNNKYAIEKRKANGLLASMYQFPLFEGFITIEKIKETFDISILEIYEIGPFKHKFTHKEWLMKGYYIKLDSVTEKYIFSSMDEIELGYTIPSAFKQFKTIIRRKSNE